MAFPWSEDAINELKALHGEGLSFSLIAVQLSKQFGAVSRNACIGKAQRLGLAKRTERSGGNFKAQSIARARKPYQRNGRRVAKPPRSVWDSGDTQADSERERVELAADASDQAVALIDVQSHHCRWPLGDPSSPDFKFCGADKFGKHSYCARHCRMAYTRHHKVYNLAEYQARKQAAIRRAREAVVAKVRVAK